MRLITTSRTIVEISSGTQSKKFKYSSPKVTMVRRCIVVPLHQLKLNSLSRCRLVASLLYYRQYPSKGFFCFSQLLLIFYPFYYKMEFRSWFVRSCPTYIFGRTRTWGEKCFLLCLCCRIRGGSRAQARPRARAPREGRAPRYQQHTSRVLLRTHSAPKPRIARAPELVTFLDS